MKNNIIDTAIKELESLYGNDASDISHGLKHMNGNDNLTIPENIAYILNLAKKEMKDNKIKDRIVTAAVSVPITVMTTLVVVCAIYKKRKEKQLNREKMKQVIEILKQEVSLSNEEKLPEDENDIILNDATTSDTQTEVPELFPSVE